MVPWADGEAEAHGEAGTWLRSHRSLRAEPAIQFQIPKLSVPPSPTVTVTRSYVLTLRKQGTTSPLFCLRRATSPTGTTETAFPKQGTHALNAVQHGLGCHMKSSKLNDVHFNALQNTCQSCHLVGMCVRPTNLLLLLRSKLSQE